LAEPLKNCFGTAIPKTIGQRVVEVYPAFPVRAFLTDALRGYEQFELMARGRHVARALARHLPADYPRAVGILVASLGAKLEGSENQGMAPFFYLPHVLFVAEFGLDHFEPSMRAQYELTQRFTAEFSIRPFLERYPEQTLARLARWAADPSAHVRRLVSEGTRPRLPWAPRLRAFQRDPRPVLKLLELLKDDPVLYVRRSVANNLNDIGKDHPAVAGKNGAAVGARGNGRTAMDRPPRVALGGQACEPRCAGDAGIRPAGAVDGVPRRDSPRQGAGGRCRNRQLRSGESCAAAAARTCRSAHPFCETRWHGPTESIQAENGRDRAGANRFVPQKGFAGGDDHAQALSRRTPGRRDDQREDPPAWPVSGGRREKNALASALAVAGRVGEPMNNVELQKYLNDNIPLSRAIGVGVVVSAPAGVILSAPLAPNINHRETVFGGSAAAVAMLAAWGLLQVRLAAEQIPARVVIQRNEMEFGKPIAADFTATAAVTDAGAWDKFLHMLRRKGRGRVSVAVELVCQGERVATFLGEFVAVTASGAPR
jgi:thioesterase domain-containing protein